MPDFADGGDAFRQRLRAARLQRMGAAPVAVQQAPAPQSNFDYARTLTGGLGGTGGWIGGAALAGRLLGAVPHPAAKVASFLIPALASTIGAGVTTQAIDSVAPHAHGMLNDAVRTVGPAGLVAGAGLGAYALMRGRRPIVAAASPVLPTPVNPGAAMMSALGVNTGSRTPPISFSSGGLGTAWGAHSPLPLHPSIHANAQLQPAIPKGPFGSPIGLPGTLHQIEYGAPEPIQNLMRTETLRGAMKPHIESVQQPVMSTNRLMPELPRDTDVVPLIRNNQGAISEHGIHFEPLNRGMLQSNPLSQYEAALGEHVANLHHQRLLGSSSPQIPMQLPQQISRIGQHRELEPLRDINQRSAFSHSTIRVRPAKKTVAEIVAPADNKIRPEIMQAVKAHKDSPNAGVPFDQSILASHGPLSDAERTYLEIAATKRTAPSQKMRLTPKRTKGDAAHEFALKQESKLKKVPVEPVKVVEKAPEVKVEISPPTSTAGDHLQGSHKQLFEALSKGMNDQFVKRPDVGERLKIARGIMTGESKAMKQALREHLKQTAPDVHAEMEKTMARKTASAAPMKTEQSPPDLAKSVQDLAGTAAQEKVRHSELDSLLSKHGPDVSHEVIEKELGKLNPTEYGVLEGKRSALRQQGIKDAARQVEQPVSSVAEHKDGNGGGKTATTGSRDSAVSQGSRQRKTKTPTETKVEAPQNVLIQNPYGDSPAGKAYMAEKTKYPDSMVLLKRGNTYEAFGSDAHEAAKHLGLKVSTLDKTSKNPISMTGFSREHVDRHLKTLESKGIKPIITEDGASAVAWRVATPKAPSGNIGTAMIDAIQAASAKTPGFPTSVGEIKSKLKAAGYSEQQITDAMMKAFKKKQILMHGGATPGMFGHTEANMIQHDGSWYNAVSMWPKE